MSIRKNLRKYHRYYYWNRERCIFVHVPKAAGTSINRAIYGRTLGHYTAVEVQSYFPGLYEKAFVFSVVRNPWDRVLSAYRFAKRGGTAYMGLANAEQYLIPEYKTFEHFLFEWLAHREPTELDFVFQPQYQFLCNDSNQIMVDYVGKVETLSDDLCFLDKKLNRTLNIQHSNTTGDGSSYIDYYRDRDMVALISQLYATDIAIFDYSFGG